MLPPEDLRKFNELDSWHDLRSTGLIIWNWALIFAAFYVCAVFPQAVIYLLAVLFLGRQQLSLTVLMHEGAHNRLFKNARLNDVIGQWLTAAPLLFSIQGYRNMHLQHHQAPLEQEPEHTFTGGYPMPRRKFYLLVARDLLGGSYLIFCKYLSFLYREFRTQKVWVLKIFASFLLVNGLMFGTLVYFGHGTLYLLWIVAMVTVLQLLFRVRGISEHGACTSNTDQRFSSRTVINTWQNWILDPFSCNYHIEHHCYPAVPHYRLAEIHKIMKERGELPAQNVHSSYRSLFEAVLQN